MRRITVIFLAIGSSFASYCGNSGIPFSFETLADGQPVLGCARPTCFGWSPKGTPASNSANFYRINKRPDGFFRKDRNRIPPFNPRDPRYYSKQTANCEPTYQSSQCNTEDQWVGGIAPLLNITAHPTILQCCTYEPLRLSTDRGTAVVAPGQIVIGGEVTKDRRQYAFDYISNVEKKYDDDGIVYYEIGIRRFPCLPVHEFTNIADEIITSEAAVREFNKFGKVSKINPFAFQSPTINADDGGIPLPDNAQEGPAPPAQTNTANEVEGPFGAEDVVVEEIIAQPGFLQVTQPPFVPPPPQAVPQPPPQVYYPPVAAAPAAPYYGGGGGGGSYYCFTDDTKVRLMDGSTKRMDELQVEDWIESVGNDGVEHVPVSFWLHKNADQFAEFQRLELEDGSELKLTAEHYIYKTECEAAHKVAPSEVSRVSVFAKDVKEGDCLYKVNGKEIVAMKVERVSTINSTGIYSPMTSTGKIVVNDIYASCHTIVQSHSLQNSFFSYVNTFNELYERIFGSAETREVPMGMSTIVQMMDIVLPKNLVTL